MTSLIKIVTIPKIPPVGGAVVGGGGGAYEGGDTGREVAVNGGLVGTPRAAGLK